VNYVDLKMYGAMIKILLTVFNDVQKMVSFSPKTQANHTSEHIFHCTLKVLVKLIQCILNVFFLLPSVWRLLLHYLPFDVPHNWKRAKV